LDNISEVKIYQGMFFYKSENRLREDEAHYHRASGIIAVKKKSDEVNSK
jgi:hypothetical protein